MAPYQQTDNRGYMILGFLVLISGFLFIAYLAWFIFKGLILLPDELSASIVAGIATILVSVLSVVLSKRWERKKEIEQKLRDQKIPIYEEFMVFWFKALFAQKAGEEKVSDKEMVKFLINFTQKLMIWGSDEVVKQYAIFKRQSGDMSELQTLDNQKKLLLIFEQLLYKSRYPRASPWHFYRSSFA